MKPRIKVITLGVSDLERSLAFYRDGLGFPTQGIIGTEFEHGAVVFFNMNDDLILALYPTTALAKEAKVPVSPTSPSAFSNKDGHLNGRDMDITVSTILAPPCGSFVDLDGLRGFGYTGTGKIHPAILRVAEAGTGRVPTRASLRRLLAAPRAPTGTLHPS
jgi:uncharacterized protein